MKNSVKSAVVLLMLIPGFLAIILVISSFFASAEEVSRIKPEELKKMIENKADILVVDTQPKSAYEMGRIKGAINFSWAMEIKGPVKLPRNKLLILYCDCGQEEDSMDVARQLIERFEYRNSNLKVLEGGWSRWLKLDYPIEKGEGK
jgi:rhodanese-related sulfurtransferase